ncbi:B2 bradykinin receptor [Bagarius yarrelli]|uniref:B2 bradykinin receptor n=1 Tax=Bagarius yarrelli TaxID=175774 RepID=A0A556U4Z1_BAGYA|nr:B2 bradykinin receptor [Bagarius yarrelli]
METEIPGTTFSALPANLTNQSLCPEIELWNWLYTMQPIYMYIICVFGILGNVFVLLVFCLHKTACSVAEIYLGNLAAADLLLTSCLPFWAINVASGFEWQFGSLMCRFVNTGIKLNMYCSIYFLVLVSVDRYLALGFALTYGRMRRPWYAKLSCLAVWILGIILSAPTLHFREVKRIEEYSVTACILIYPSHTVELVCNILLVLLGFIIPMIVITYCTCKIIQALHWQKMGRFNAANKERKATVLVLAVLLAFLVCWIPFHMVTILDILFKAEVLSGCTLENVIDICNQIFTYLALSNSVLNPILYVIVGKNFRKKVMELQSSTRKTFA